MQLSVAAAIRRHATPPLLPSGREMPVDLKRAQRIMPEDNLLAVEPRDFCNWFDGALGRNLVKY